MNENSDISGSVIFPKGAKVTTGNFIGDVWLEELVSPADNLSFTVGNVTFAPGARNNWHKHPGGQTLLVTGGKGYFKQEGEPARVMQAGAVIKIPPDVRHWHGAAHDSWLVHIAISARTPKGVVEWMEPVTDKEYCLPKT